MNVNLVVLGLIFDIIGVLILTLTTILKPRHGRREDLKWWNKKRYWWNGWRPLFRVHPSNEKARWMIKLNHKPIIFGMLPPKYKLNIMGFLFILIGFALQLRFYLT